MLKWAHTHWLKKWNKIWVEIETCQKNLRKNDDGHEPESYRKQDWIEWLTVCLHYVLKISVIDIPMTKALIFL